jgi:proteic killer suppression protein
MMTSLEKLRGDLAGYWNLRINDQWHIIFRWEGNDALDDRDHGLPQVR